MKQKLKHLLMASLIICIVLLALLPGCVKPPSPPEPAPTPVLPPSASAKPSPLPPATTAADPLEGITLSSEYIVAGEITGITYEMIIREPYTIYKVSVEKVIKGAPDTKEVFFRLWGGPIDGGWAELVGQDAYLKGDKILAFLANESDGVFNNVEVNWIWGDIIKSDPELEVVICRVIKIMETHNLPVSLPQGEIDCSDYNFKDSDISKPRVKA